MLLLTELYRKYFALAKALWNKQNQSTPSADIIEDILGRRLPTPNDTRWNALFDAVKVLVAQKPKLNAVMDALGFRQFSNEEFLFAEEYIQATKALAISLDTLQSDKASLGCVLPTIVKLEAYYKNIISQNSLMIAEPMAKFILKDLQNRVKKENYFTDKDYILGKVFKINTYNISLIVPTCHQVGTMI